MALINCMMWQSSTNQRSSRLIRIETWVNNVFPGPVVWSRCATLCLFLAFNPVCNCAWQTQLHRCECGKFTKSAGSVSQTQQFSASADLKWRQHAGGGNSCHAWAEELGWRWESWAGIRYLTKGNPDLKKKLTHSCDWFSSSENTTWSISILWGCLFLVRGCSVERHSLVV